MRELVEIINNGQDSMGLLVVVNKPRSRDGAISALATYEVLVPGSRNQAF